MPRPISIHVAPLEGAPTPEHLALHLAAIEYELSAPITIESREDIQSQRHWSDKIKPFEHQIQNLITFCRRAPVALFADDVGLGKTISAGLVLNELQTRRKVRRALVLARGTIHAQWKQELFDKFGIKASHAVGQNLLSALQSDSPVIITSYETARDRMDEIRRVDFDMLIMDEAHKVRNLHPVANAPLVATRLRKALEDRAFQYVLMLTATPIYNRLWDIYSIIDCLRVARGHEHPLGSPEDFVDDYIADGPQSARRVRHESREKFRLKLQDYMVRTSRSSANLSFPKRVVKTVQCQASPVEVALEGLVQVLVNRLPAGAQSLTTLSLGEALMSSPRALWVQVERMQQGHAFPQAYVSQLRDRVMEAGPGSKMPELLRILRGFRNEMPQNWRALVFTKRKETLELILEHLAKEDIRAKPILSGALAANNRNIQAFNQNPPSVHVLVGTDVAAEGFNLQACNVIINYDLPWSPMVLEQRIGRVQRLGSTFASVHVFNLTIRDTVEDLVVATLLSKLQLISETIGDIESILEASDYEDADSFERKLKDLVVRAMQGHDVREALRLAQASIDKAKKVYDEAREDVEKNLGGLDAMHRSGPDAPKLGRRSPRLGVRDFFRLAYDMRGATLNELQNGQIEVRSPGQAPWTATFDPDDPGLRGTTGIFGGESIHLVQEGTKRFERLVGEWRETRNHRILDRREEAENGVKLALEQWIQGMGVGMSFLSYRTKEKSLRFQGKAHVRATANVAHDRYEKLCQVEIGDAESLPLPAPSADTPVLIDCNLEHLDSKTSEKVSSAIEGDRDMTEFARFYDQRRQEEMERAGTDRYRLEVSNRFETSFSGDVVGAEGVVHWECIVGGTFASPDGKTKYTATLRLVPLTGQILWQPDGATCSESQAVVPEDWLEKCAVSGQRALKHLLRKSAVSGIVALPRYFGTCAETQRTLLKRELARSDESGLMVGLDLLKKSEISEKRALEREMATCEFTTKKALLSETEISGVSGKRFRSDQAARSECSGTRGHASEFRRCFETKARILESEGGHSDVSGNFVRLALLVPSEKNPQRRGTQAELVKCVESGKKILLDEGVQSVVSGAWIDKDLAVYSDQSGKPGRPCEMVTCGVTGATLLAAETATSAVSGLVFDAQEMGRSQVSGKPCHESEIRTCEFCGFKILPDEGFTSDLTSRFSCIGHRAKSSVSETYGHLSEFVTCGVTGAFLAASECKKSDLSGTVARADLLSPSDAPGHRLGLETEMVNCEASGRRLLKDEVGKSKASGKRVDASLLVKSEVSGAKALLEELTTCEQTGLRMLPCESAKCVISGKCVDRRRLRSSPRSRRLALPEYFVQCAFSGASLVEDEVLASAVSGRACDIDLLKASALSGKLAHPSEMVRCAITHELLLPSEVEHSSVSDLPGRADLLVVSDSGKGRKGLPEEVRTCSVSGLRLLCDEVAESDVSGKPVGLDLLQVSAVSSRRAAASEMVTCAVTGKVVLPDESGTCAITGKRVIKSQLRISEKSGRPALASHVMACGYTGIAMLEDEVAPSAVTGKLCDVEILEASSLSGSKAHPSELVTCVVSGQRLLPSEVVISSVSQKPARADLVLKSDEPPHRVGLPDEMVSCSVSGRQLLVDEVGKSDVSGKWVGLGLLRTSGVSQRRATAAEMVICEATGQAILPDESGICSVSGRQVIAGLLKRSGKSGRMALEEHVVECGYSGMALLSDEVAPSAVTGKLCDMEILEASSLSGSKAHPSELVICSVTGQRLLPAEVRYSSVSQRPARKDVLLNSQRNPVRVGLPEECVICAATEKRLLVDEVVSSDVSQRRFDKLLAIRSPVGGRIAMPSEVVLCEESGIQILPDESEVCGITGKRVDRRLLGTSDLGGTTGLKRLLLICPETATKGFAHEFATCEATQLRVVPSLLGLCSVTGRRMLLRLMVQCDVTHQWLKREEAVTSSASGRIGHPETLRTCIWTGQRVLADEGGQCGLTGAFLLTSLLVDDAKVSKPMVELLGNGIPSGGSLDALQLAIKETLVGLGLKARSIATVTSQDQRAIAYLADCSGLLGMAKRHVLGYAKSEGGITLVHEPCTGILRDGIWTPRR